MMAKPDVIGSTVDATVANASVFGPKPDLLGPQGMKRSVASDIAAPLTSPPRAASFDLGPAPLKPLGAATGQATQPQPQPWCCCASCAEQQGFPHEQCSAPQAL